MTATIIDSLDAEAWKTLACILFVFLATCGLSYASYRHYRKPAPMTPNQRAYLEQTRRDYADDRLTQMSRHRADVAEHFGEKHQH